MTRMLRRAPVSAGLVLCGWSTLLLAQSTTVAVPDRTLIRRALPVAPVEAPAPPVVQQSPNGLYKLSITDNGIELRGPHGTVTINNAGITIGGPGTLEVAILSSGLNVRTDRDASYRAGQNMRLEGSANVQVRGGATAEVSGAGGAYLTGAQVTVGSCSNAKPAARVGDQVNTSTGPTAVIAQGSPMVFIC